MNGTRLPHMWAPRPSEGEGMQWYTYVVTRPKAEGLVQSAGLATERKCLAGAGHGTAALRGTWSMRGWKGQKRDGEAGRAAERHRVWTLGIGDAWFLDLG